MTSRLLNLFAHVVIAVEVEDVSDEIQCMLIVLDVSVEAREVETIGEIVFVNFAEVLVTSRIGELRRRLLATLNEERRAKHDCTESLQTL